MHGLRQEFDAKKFNFNLIDQNKELICILRKTTGTGTALTKGR
jgi:hypothetical protein